MQVWLIRKNCSLTPAQTMSALAAACMVIVLIGMVFAVAGHWLVLAFACVEAGLLAALVLRYCRHATDCERLTLSHDVLTVEVTECGRTTRRDLIASLVRFDTETSGRMLMLRYGNDALPVGRHLCGAARQRLAEELRRSCRRPARAEDDDAPPRLVVVVNDFPVTSTEPWDR